MSWIVLIVIIFIAAVLLLMLIRAARFAPRPVASHSLPEAPVDIGAAISHLCEAISIRTVSDPDEEKMDWAEFERFHGWLEQAYPAAHEALDHEVVGRASLLYRWAGSEPAGARLKPFGLLAHMDVVPVEEATLGDWSYPPFEGHDDGDTVWGRGANDMKNHLVALFEAIEALLREGYKPLRDIYICIGHNEETQVGGQSGARAIARLLQERGVHMEFVLDEGGAVIEDPPFGVNSPAAMVGLAEKGYANFVLSVADDGGHAAEPPPLTALGNLARALAAIEAAPMKQRLVTPVTLTFDALGRHMGLPLRLALANLWLTKPLVLPVLAKDRQTNAMTRTTIAATMAEASPAANVLPQRAAATVNVRILPGETEEDVRAHIGRVAARAGITLEIEVAKYSPPVGMRTGEWAYEAILRFLPAIRESILPVPYLVTGATDSREYAEVADEIYRFYPFLLSGDELASMHATDERVRHESLAGALRFNYHFIKEAGLRK